MEKEIFKDVQSNPDYQVSNKGNIIKKAKTVIVKKNNGIQFVRQYNAKVMKPQLVSSGYLQIHLGDRFYYVHRLVAEAFLPNKENLPIINHKDQIKTHNNVENLEWCDHSYNLTYGDAMEKKAQSANEYHTMCKSIDPELVKHKYTSAIQDSISKHWSDAYNIYCNLHKSEFENGKKTEWRIKNLKEINQFCKEYGINKYYEQICGDNHEELFEGNNINETSENQDIAYWLAKEILKEISK